MVSGHLIEWEVVEFNTVDGFIVTVVQVGSIFNKVPGVWAWDSCELAVAFWPYFIGLADFLGLFECLLGPGTGSDVVDLGLVLKKVEGDSAELHGSSSLEEEDDVVLGYIQKFPEVFLGLLGDGDELLGSVTHFHNRDAAVVPVQHFLLGLLEHFLG